jgi:hypothetical protein
MNAASIIVFILLLAGLFSPLSWLTYLLFCLSPFGAMSVVPPAWIGGVNLTPSGLAAALFIVRAVMMPRILTGTTRALFAINLLGCLGLFLLVAAIGAFLLPRMFDGAVYVFTMRAPVLSTVAPSMSNLAQTAYLALSIISGAVVCAVLRRRPEFIDVILRAVLAGGCVAIATGLIDMIANMTGHGDALKAFYTADYGYSAGQILGSRRVMGLTPEPASFGGMCAGLCALLVFLRPAYPRRLWKWKVPLVGWGFGVMAFLSESSTAFAAMFVIIGLYVLYDAHSISDDGKIVRKPIARKLFWGCAALGILPVIVFVGGEMFSFVGNMVNTLIFEKHNTSSYIQRSSWTATGLDAFVESYGLGVGVGSIRTSNFFVNVLASTGVVGSLLFGIFITMTYRRHAIQRDSRSEAIIKAMKLALVPMFTASYFAGTTPDIGVGPCIMFGVIAAFAAKPSPSLPQAPLTGA